MSDLFWLTDEQIERLRSFFPKSYGKPRVDDRRVLSGIVFVNRNGMRWRHAHSEYGPHKPVPAKSRGRCTIAGSLGARSVCSHE
jgi:transposase